MPNKADVAIVGGGILGLANAYVQARRGRSVVVFERSERAWGASVRNFGMIWPIGQPSGRMHQMALRSRELWLEVLEAAAIPYRNTGSLHVVYRDDEAEVAREFAVIGPGLGYDCQWLAPQQVLAKSDAVVARNLLGALWSPTELTVDPRLTLAALPAFLAERHGVRFVFGRQVKAIDLPWLETTVDRWAIDNAIVCSGDDFATLYPKVFEGSALTRCKLQMLRTVPQPANWQLGPSLAAGLTLRFYAAFQACSSLPALQRRIAEETPEYDHWGIHALVSQTAKGELTLGDSHEYGRAVDLFDKVEIDELILKNLRTFLRAPTLAIAERWHGVYAKHPTEAFVCWQPQPGVTILTAPGGSGMTLSFGLAETQP